MTWVEHVDDQGGGHGEIVGPFAITWRRVFISTNNQSETARWGIDGLPDYDSEHPLIPTARAASLRPARREMMGRDHSICIVEYRALVNPTEGGHVTGLDFDIVEIEYPVVERIWIQDPVTPGQRQARFQRTTAPTGEPRAVFQVKWYFDYRTQWAQFVTASTAQMNRIHTITNVQARLKGCSASPYEGYRWLVTAEWVVDPGTPDIPPVNPKPNVLFPIHGLPYSPIYAGPPEGFVRGPFHELRLVENTQEDPTFPPMVLHRPTGVFDPTGYRQLPGQPFP